MLGEWIESSPVASCSLVLLLYVSISIVTEKHVFSDLAHLAKTTSAYVQKYAWAIQYLLRGADEIEKAYAQANGKPFTIHTPGRKHHMVTSQEHIAQINRAPLDVLSLHAVAKDFLQPKDTMHGFVWKDIRGLEGTGFVRALRTTLTNSLPSLIPTLNNVVGSHIRSDLKGLESSEGVYEVPVYKMAKRLVTRCNCTVFFGSKLANDEEFFEACREFPHDSARAAEIIRLLPSGVGRLIARAFTRNFHSASTLHRRLSEEIRQRLSVRDDPSITQAEQKNDGLQWLIDTSPKKNPWSVDRLVGEMMGIWYGSVHTLSIATTFALLDLYSHPEYIASLRTEAESIGLENMEAGRSDMPLLDSFLSESARLSAFESTGVRRQALQPFEFSDGLRLDVGDWVCVPHRSMMRDLSKFEDALKFDGRRFLKRQQCSETGKGEFMTDSSGEWLVWGVGRILCPGRFYAAAVLKLVVARMLVEYDCTLVEDHAEFGNGSPRREYQWRSTVVPRESVRLSVRER